MWVALDGPEHTEAGRIDVAEAAGWGLAISKGLDSPAPKVDPNEDACGVLAGERVVAVVADAHWGAASAVELVRGFGQHGLTPEALDAAREALDGERSECAWLAVEVRDRRVRWWSQGDCRLYRTGLGVVNPLLPAYFGARFGVRGVRQGSFELAEGERLVLASDGLPECIYGEPTLDPAAVLAEVHGDAVEVARRLTALALEHGGEDNIAVVVSP